jgi:hypothetical protein
MPAAEAGFVHLHVHAYSLREARSLGKLIDLWCATSSPLAVTDQ